MKNNSYLPLENLIIQVYNCTSTISIKWVDLTLVSFELTYWCTNRCTNNPITLIKTGFPTFLFTSLSFKTNEIFIKSSAYPLH